MQAAGAAAEGEVHPLGIVRQRLGVVPARLGSGISASQQANIHHVPNALKILVLRGEGQIIFPRHSELIGVVEIKAMPAVDFSEPGIAGFAQRKNGELRQRIRRELVEQFRPLLAEQQHAVE